MICHNCGKEGPHYVAPSFGEPGFFICVKKPVDLRSEDVNLVDDIRDEQGRRRYTLGSVDGSPSMIPDAEGFWTPVNDETI